MNDRTKQIIKTAIEHIYAMSISPGWIDPVTGKEYKVLEEQYHTFGTQFGGKDFWKDLTAYQDRTPKPKTENKYEIADGFNRKTMPRVLSLPKIIGLHGVAKSGKSTAAAILKTYGYVEIPLAAPLKRSIAAIFHIPVELLEEQGFKESMAPIGGIPWRKYLQGLGAEGFGRALDPEYWIRLNQFSVRKALSDKNVRGVVIPDIRFSNEAEYVRREGGIVLKIERLNGERLYGDLASHPSEQGISEHLVDLVIKNVGTIHDLEKKILSGISSWNNLQNGKKQINDFSWR